MAFTQNENESHCGVLRREVSYIVNLTFKEIILTTMLEINYKGTRGETRKSVRMLS